MKIVLGRIFCFSAAFWASTSGGFRIVSDTLVLTTRRLCRRHCDDDEHTLTTTTMLTNDDDQKEDADLTETAIGRSAVYHTDQPRL